MSEKWMDEWDGQSGRRMGEDEWDDEWEGEPFCWTCNGRGWVVVCMDDLCHGTDCGCIHGGKGNMACPDCEGGDLYFP